MIIELSRLQVWVTSAPAPDDYPSDPDELPDYVDMSKKQEQQMHKFKGKGAEGYEAEEFFKAKQEREAREETITFYPCDKRSDLYVMNKTFIKEEHAKSPRSSTIDAR